ncbi:MAG: hypothetical protein JWR10_2900 [Rubritepida sp.]|nr:hypothetical protein [Rubritepida sp.]
MRRYGTHDAKGRRVTFYRSADALPDRKGRDHLAAGQARPWVLAVLLLTGGCAVPALLNPRLIGRDLSGASTEARLLPPGMDRPTPNLASVPPIPERPDVATRDALTRRLEVERAASTTEVPAVRPDTPLTEPDAPGQPPVPARPPGQAALAPAAAVPWVTSQPRTAPTATPAPGVTPPELLTPERLTPGAVPNLPSPELLAPAPPSRPASPEPMAPGAVPALPPADLLAPAPRAAPATPLIDGLRSGEAPSPPPPELLAPR